MKCFPLLACKFCGFRTHINTCSHQGRQCMRTILPEDAVPFPKWCPLPDCACPVAAMEQVKI
jgi:hypothetical protein